MSRNENQKNHGLSLQSRTAGAGRVDIKTQLEINLERFRTKDHHLKEGGKSFYFFDFDDNVAILSTPIIIFHQKTRSELALSSSEFAQNHNNLGKRGPFREYKIDFCDRNGSFRHFRDEEFSLVDKQRGKRQSFVHDTREAIKNLDSYWKAPAWDFFYHAIYNKRPVSIITARGHNENTIKEGIDEFVRSGHLPGTPNYLSIFPVSNPQIRKDLGDPGTTFSVPELKRLAIRKSVEMAFEKYGYNPYHRFGMSDDDPKNVELITTEMQLLKEDYPEVSFFVIETKKDRCIKREIIRKRKLLRKASSREVFETQLTLF